MSTTSPVSDQQTPAMDVTSPTDHLRDVPQVSPSTAPQQVGQPFVQQPIAEPKAFSVSSLVLGIASLAFGYTFIVPIVGLVLGILALKREPSNSVMSWWGIVLSGLSLLGGVLIAILGIVFILPLSLAGIFAG